VNTREPDEVPRHPGGRHRFDTVLATPQIGYVTREEYELRLADILDQVASFAAGPRRTWST
jgi:phosphoglycerate dehydrogenase-like enzyme